MPEIKHIEKTKQKMIITSLIVSDIFSREIIPILKINKTLTHEVFSGYYNIVLKWIMSYYEKYECAPKKNIQNIYEVEIENSRFEKEDVNLISMFLENLNDTYEREENYNEQYVIDQAKLFLRECNLEVLQKKIDEAKADGQLDEAENLINNFYRIDRETAVHQITDIFNEIDKVVEEISKRREILFKFPGALEKCIGGVYRGSFVCVVGPAKRGKSWWLEEIGVQAALQNLRVIVFNLEMSHEEYEQRLCQNFLGEVSYLDGEFVEVEVPTFVRHGEKYIIENITYKKRGIHPKRVSKKLKNMRSKVRSGQLKVVSFPANTMTIGRMDAVLDDLVLYENFVPDVIIVDYADIILSTSSDEHRHKIDDKWKNLRGLAQKKHCMVVTGSHSNRATFLRDITQSDPSEDYRKLNHVTLMLGLNQTSKEEKKGIMRINQLANRHHRFNPESYVVVLQCLEIGKCLLDSKYYKDIDYKEIFKDEE